MSGIPVLHIITRLIVGGAQENTMYTAARLDPTRFCVEVISGPQTGSEGSLIDEVRSLGVSLEILPSLLREVSPRQDVAALLALRRLIRTGQFAIVHTHSSKAGILGRVAARLAGVPVIVHTVHGWSFHEHMSPRRRRLYVALERWTARFTDALIVVARPDIEKGLAEGIGRREQYHLIRSAIPLEAFDPTNIDSSAVRRELGLPLNVPVLGNVGRFSAQKNPLDWVAVAGRVAQAVPDCHFLLVGDGPLRSDVETALTAAGIADRTILTGLRRDVPRLIAAMDVFLLTSLWEGLPRVIPQAMSMGIPVVANRADGTVEAINHGVTGFLCEPGSTESMAENCCLLLQNPQLRQEMGGRGQKYAHQEFGLERMIRDIEALYEDLLQRHTETGRYQQSSKR
jgi:glycosyltransferase involved in cell wall biosynthesis